MRHVLAIFCLLVASPVAAQVVSQPNGVTPDMVPKPGTATPRTEVPGGDNGASAPMLYAPALHQHPRISRSAKLLVGTNGTVSVTWKDPLPAGYPSYPVYFTGIGTTTAMPPSCTVQTSTNTGFSATCRRPVVSLTLLSTPLLELLPQGSEIFALSLPSTE